MRRFLSIHLLHLLILILTTLIIYFPLISCSGKSTEKKEIIVVFRYDDYSARSRTDIDLKIIEAFRKNDVSITFGIIPYVFAGDVHDASPQDVVPLNRMKSDILKTAFEDGIVDIALHGYSHQTISAKGGYTEFFGLDYNSQLERIAKGKKLLEYMTGVPIGTFIPPWNSYDLNTLRALEKLQFSTISASLNGDVEGTSRLKFLPQTSDLVDIRNAVDSARRSSDVQPVIVAFFHNFEFREVDKKRGRVTFHEFLNLLNWLKSQRDVRLVSISQAVSLINDLSANCYLANKHISSVSTLLPPFLRPNTPYVYSISEKSLNKSLNLLYLRISLFLSSIFVFDVLIAFGAGNLLFPRSSLIMNIGKYGSLGVLIIILIYAFHDLQVYYKGITVSALLLGISIGVWLCCLYLKKQRSLG